MLEAPALTLTLAFLTPKSEYDSILGYFMTGFDCCFYPVLTLINPILRLIDPN